jgi:hypothetical protein
VSQKCSGSPSGETFALARSSALPGHYTHRLGITARRCSRALDVNVRSFLQASHVQAARTVIASVLTKRASRVNTHNTGIILVLIW